MSEAVVPAETTGQPDSDASVPLVSRAQDGDLDAFTALVKTYQRRVVSVAYRLLGNNEDARDVGQEAFVRAFRNLSQLADPSRFGPWLMRTVTNLALNYRRSRALRAAASLDDNEAMLDAPRRSANGYAVAGDWRAESGSLPGEVHDAVTQAIESLPEKQRLALILFSIEGMPQKEVAQVLDCSVELVKWNVFQARKKLKELLADYLD